MNLDFAFKFFICIFAQMKKIANILTTSKKVSHFNDFECYNIVSKKEDLIDGLPTLIIGWKLVNELYDSFDILSWKITDNVYWTFGKRERAEKYESDIIEFEKMIFNNLSDKVKYIFINIFTDEELKKEVFKKIKDKNISKTCYIENDMLFIHFDDDVVYGLSLRDIDYEGKDRKKILSLVYAESTVVKNKEFLPYDVRIRLLNIPYIIPYIA